MWYIFLLVLLFNLNFSYPLIRGKMGELWVRKALSKLPKKEYYILNDIMLEDKYGTHQIDHIVLSNKGIFVIETKNYYGLILGKKKEKKWCQFLGKHKSYFLNPF